MPDCSHCGRFINTSATGWTCGCEGERAECARLREPTKVPPMPEVKPPKVDIPHATYFYFDSIDGSPFWVRNWFATRDQADADRKRLTEAGFNPVDEADACSYEVLPVYEYTAILTPEGVLAALASMGDPNDI